MADACSRHDIKLLTYGTLVSLSDIYRQATTNNSFPQCGGFIADKWLSQPEPDVYDTNITPSQRKVSKSAILSHKNTDDSVSTTE